MNVATLKNGRPPAKRDRVVNDLRERIVAGKLAPGARVASQKELEQQYHASSDTVQDAMRVLREDGFIESQLRRGTFVVPHPPHISQFAFAFPFSPDHQPQQFFWAIRAEVERWQRPACHVQSFFDLDAEVSTKDYQRLLRYVQSDRLAGLVFVSHPFVLRHRKSPITGRLGLPRVMIELEVDKGGFPAVYPDTPAFIPKAFDYLAMCGCKRVAVVNIATVPRELEVTRVPRLAAERGLLVKPQWLQAVPAELGSWIQQLGRLLVQGAPGERPDGLVIADDNLVPELTAGLALSGVKVRACGEPGQPGDLVVVAHTNFPYPTPSAVPVTRLGYDVPKLVGICMELLDQQRRGEAPPPLTLLPVMFEGELN